LGQQDGIRLAGMDAKERSEREFVVLGDPAWAFVLKTYCDKT
jgi:hypothetical protein